MIAKELSVEPSSEMSNSKSRKSWIKMEFRHSARNGPALYTGTRMLTLGRLIGSGSWLMTIRSWKIISPASSQDVHELLRQFGMAVVLMQRVDDAAIRADNLPAIIELQPRWIH